MSKNAKAMARQRPDQHRHQRHQQHVNNTLSQLALYLRVAAGAFWDHILSMHCVYLSHSHISIIILKVNGQAKYKEYEYEYTICMQSVDLSTTYISTLCVMYLLKNNNNNFNLQ